MPCDVLCLAVENRELMTKQLMDLFRQNTKRNVQMYHVVVETLSNEFQFIGRLKLLMLVRKLRRKRIYLAIYVCIYLFRFLVYIYGSCFV